ncbi:hypothetical protein IW261DRAFT_1502936 [Armillaria novae-zelandiae]|uniref:Uncharacterized protein n=1 Tax=Armillaria novae-zelandiae TaxID=153914 RepID=A0AA39NXH2_9AGAR|nr:hypothetical protein IW261DRAFT_1502936 [Armillaria novae-zelandiae]
MFTLCRHPLDMKGLAQTCILTLISLGVVSAKEVSYYSFRSSISVVVSSLAVRILAPQAWQHRSTGHLIKSIQTISTPLKLLLLAAGNSKETLLASMISKFQTPCRSIACTHPPRGSLLHYR